MSKTEEKIKLINLAKSIQNLEMYNKGLVSDDDLIYFSKNLMYYNSKLLPLPSKREGNILALALELNYYYSALYLIENANEYNIDINNIATNGKKNYSLEDELKYSLETMSDYQRICDEFLKPMLELNIEAYEKLCNKYNVKKRVK